MKLKESVFVVGNHSQSIQQTMFDVLDVKEKE